MNKNTVVARHDQICFDLHQLTPRFTSTQHSQTSQWVISNHNKPFPQQGPMLVRLKAQIKRHPRIKKTQTPSKTIERYHTCVSKAKPRQIIIYLKIKTVRKSFTLITLLRYLSVEGQQNNHATSLSFWFSKVVCCCLRTGKRNTTITLLGWYSL